MYTNCFLLLLQIRSRIPVPLILDCVSSGQKVPVLLSTDDRFFLRGTLECAIFPKTGYPSTDIDYWKKIYRAVKDHGLNHVRFHSWCPPEVAFDAADEMGVYLQVECSSWANQSTQLGSGLPVDQYIWDESERIVKSNGSHPSFV